MTGVLASCILDDIKVADSANENTDDVKDAVDVAGGNMDVEALLLLVMSKGLRGLLKRCDDDMDDVRLRVPLRRQDLEQKIIKID